MKELIEIQSELKAPKNQRNSSGGYNYRSAEDILEAVKPLLKAHGCLLFISDDVEFVNNRYYIKATATIMNQEGQSISTTAFAREEESKKGMDGAQITGSDSSYARKYALNGLFCIDDTKDPDYTNTHGKDEKRASKDSTEKTEIDYSQLDIAIQEAKEAKTVEEVSAVWKRWLCYQKTDRFINIIKDRGNELKKK